MLIYSLFFLFKQKTAYEMRISDWSSDVCSSDLGAISFLSPCVLPLVPGITAEKKSKPGKLRQGAAVSIEGLTPGVAYKLADCCHPVPGDRIVGLAREGEGIEVHVIDCPSLADGIDAEIGRASCRERVCQSV